MFYIKEKDGTISLTRGDTAKFRIEIQNELNETPYEILETDKLEFSIKKKLTDIEPLVHKEVVGSNLIVLEPSDTKELDFKNYLYDVQLTTNAGEVYTVIGPNTFEVLGEVTTE